MNKMKLSIQTKPIIVFIFLRFSIEVIADCGLPAIPCNSFINEIKSKYDEGFKCEYKCEFEELSLIEGKFRTCINGRWTGKIPRCVEKFSNEYITQLEVSDISNKSHKIYSYQKEIVSCIESDLSQYGLWKQKWFIRFDKTVRHVVYFEMDFHVDHNNSLNIIRAHTNDIRGCTHEKLNTSYSSSLTRYGFRCDIKFEGQKAYSAWDLDQTLGLTIEFDEPVVTICNLNVYHETYARYHWCGVNEKPLNSKSEYLTGSEKYRELISFRYSCIDGFKLIGNNEVRCSASNYWLDEFPICIPNQTYCELHSNDSSNTSKGYKVEYENLYNFNLTSFAIEGSLAIYSCLNQSHLLIGDSIRVCNGNGKWIGVQEPFCSDINELKTDVFNETQELVIDLNIYEDIDADSDKSCGIPSIPLYTRLVEPKPLSIITHVMDLRPVYANGSQVMYYCESTYKWIYGEQSLRQCIDGQWIGNTSNCFVNWEQKMLLTSIEVSNHIETEGNSEEIKHIIDIKPREEVEEWDYLYSFYRDITQNECQPIIELNVKQKLTFYFNDSQVITYIIMNLNPNKIFNASLFHSNIIVAEVGEKSCKIVNFEDIDGMTALAFDCSQSINITVNKIVIYFNPQNSSKHNISLCLLNVLYNPKVCGKPDEPLNSIVKTDSVSGIASYSCDSGYELIGNPIIHCGANGQWMGSAPKCVPKQLCSITLNNDTNLNIRYFNTEIFNGEPFAKHKTIAFYSCENTGNRTDFILIGSRIRMCLLSGKWSGSQPICKAFIASDNETLNGGQESNSNQFIFIILTLVLLIIITTSVIIVIKRFDLSFSFFTNYLRFS